jgi:hypothetical protein
MGRSLLLVCALMLSGCVERMFFYPDRVQYMRPADVGLAHEDVDITTADGVRLHGWWLPAQGAARGSVLHLHGNAANVSNHLPLVAWLPPAGFNVLMVDYRGFGASEGTPAPDSVVEDGLAALRYLRARGDTDPARLIVFGQSLGGATALRVLARDAEGVRLAIIDSAFASYRGIALAPLAPLAGLLPDAASDPAIAVAQLRLPLLFVSGTADQVIPPQHSDRLYAAANEPKRLIVAPGAHHMEALMRRDVQAQVMAAMLEALR